MSPTLTDLMRAKVPVAVCVYYWNLRHKRNAWAQVREWVHREFRGIDDKVVTQLITIAKQAVREAGKLNRKRG